MFTKNALLAAVTLSGVAVTQAAAKELPETSADQQSRILGAYYGAMAADALTLGSHYEYDAAVIKRAYGGKKKPLGLLWLEKGKSKKGSGKYVSPFLAPGDRMGGSTHGVGWGRMNYHPGQGAGDQTDYGLYNLLSLKYAAQAANKEHKGKIDQEVSMKTLLPVWDDMVGGDDWGAWKCSQTKQALQKYSPSLNKKSADQVQQRLGGYSNAMGVRHAGVYGAYGPGKKGEDAVARAAKHLLFTHVNGEALAGAEFFARLSHRLIWRDHPASLESWHKSQDSSTTLPKLNALVETDASKIHSKEAADLVHEIMKQAARSTKTDPQFALQQVKKGYNKYVEAVDCSKDLIKQEFVDDLAMTSMARLWDVGKSEPIKVGKASPTEGTMPSTIYLILKYVSGSVRDCDSKHAGVVASGIGYGFEAAAVANAMVGGDNASRSVALGSVLGALYGMEGVEEAGSSASLGGLGANNPDNSAAKLRTLTTAKESAKLLQELPLLASGSKASEILATYAL